MTKLLDQLVAEMGLGSIHSGQSQSDGWIDLGGTVAVLLDEWTPAEAERLSRLAWFGGPTLLPVRVDGTTVIVGPLLAPGAPACLGCAEAWRLATVGGRTPRRQGDLALGGLAAPTALPLIAAVITAAVADPDAHAGTVWAVRTANLTCSLHRARPRAAGCSICHPLPQDTPAGAAIALAGGQGPDPARLRTPNEATTLAGLRAALFDWRFGPIAHVSRREQFPIALAHAEVVGDWEVRDGGYGRGMTYRDAERIALFEGVERMAGLGPRARRTVLRASFAQLGAERALDPTRLGQHEPEAELSSEYELARYDPHTEMDWVHGWSVNRKAPIAVPEQVAYWGLPLPATDRFLMESSNGCGLGNSPAEAALYGLLEIAERDAFLMAWYARTPLPQVEVPDDDPLVCHLVDQVDALGYDVLLFDATNDFAVPVVVTLVLSRDVDSPAPQALFAAGAHPDPRQAIRSGVVEAAVNLLISADFSKTKPWLYDRERLRHMLADSRLVHTPDDHLALYTLPEARSRYEFLLEGDAPKPWWERFPNRPEPVHDLADLVAEMAAVAGRSGMEVIVVEQSDPVVSSELGLHAAKVVVPGSLPLSFGHVYRRTRNVPRLLDVPFRLGRLASRPAYEQLALDPHPFP